MHKTIENLNYIQNQINSKILKLNNNNYKPKIIAISKTFKIDHILPLIDHGHKDFGENKVQEALEKWSKIKSKNKNIKLHMVGKLQTNKVKFVVKLFDYIHSVDSEKLAKKIADEQSKLNKNIKIFIQVNIGKEPQKSGIDPDQIGDMVAFCRDINLNVIGLMCIPPIENDASVYFEKMKKINNSYNFNELSMGMSSDYLDAAKNSATFLRIGSNIFGQRY